MNMGLLPVVVLAALMPSDPGKVAVVHGDLAVVTFELPEGTPYRAAYPIAARSVNWFDRAETQLVDPDVVYAARSKGDLNGDGVLNGGDIEGFVCIALGAPFDAEADLNDDGVVDIADVPGFLEAVLHGFPADGVVMYVDAQAPSVSLGDAAVDLLTDPDNDDVFTIDRTQPVTTVQFGMPAGDLLGRPTEIFMDPAIAPLVFDASTTAVWTGEVLLSTGVGPILTVDFTTEQVRERTPDNAAILHGDGVARGVLPDEAVLNTIGITNGRITFNLNGIPVTTQ